jgi:hypothetical protein
MAFSHDGWPSRWGSVDLLQSGDRFDPPMMLPERGPATTDAAIPARVFVDVNTLVVRTDLGPNRFTFVAAHTQVPASLVGFSRVPA